MSANNKDEQVNARKFSPSQYAFLAAYSETGNISRAARIANTSRTSHYEWLKLTPGYEQAFRDAEDEAIDALESEARRRAAEGLVRKKFDRFGKPIIDPATGEQYVEHEYSDTLLITLLKATRPEKFKDRQEHSGPHGGPITVARYDLEQLRKLSTDDIRKLRDIQRTLAAPDGGDRSGAGGTVAS